jgi:hypothetical protein
MSHWESQHPSPLALPDLSQSLADQQPSSIQSARAPFKFARPPPPSASMLLSQSSPPEQSRYFSEADDARLRSIMSGYPPKLSRGQWRAVVATFASGKTVHQLQDRWNNYAKPGLDASPLSLAERWQAATCPPVCSWDSQISLNQLTVCSLSLSRSNWRIRAGRACSSSPSVDIAS